MHCTSTTISTEIKLEQAYIGERFTDIGEKELLYHTKIIH